jgi:hypothetical protein
VNAIRSASLDAGTGWLILAGFSVLWVILGTYLGRRSVGLGGYMLAGRKVGLALGTTTVVTVLAPIALIVL